MDARKEKNNISAEKLALYNKLIATIPNLERKGATMPYTSLNGHMFSFFAKDGTFALRLPEDLKEEFLKKYKTTLHEAYGTILKEYAVVSEKLLKDIKELKKYFKISYEYVNILKPKTQKKIKTATKKNKNS